MLSLRSSNPNWKNTSQASALCKISNSNPNPVKIQIERYSLAPSATGCLLTIHDYSCPTHEWLAKLGKKIRPTFEIPLPVPYAMASAFV
ncbi:MAG: hypothetical protein NTZ08_04625 [Verrucomicrobia bacterium]|nr:hypothetical protein [Verrucomicrobiota bacterium]